MNQDTETTVEFPSAVRQDIEGALSERFGTTLRLAAVQNLFPSSIFRCTLQSSTPGVPPSVIVRLPRTGTTRSGLERLDTERRALEYLNAVGSTLAQRFLAGGSDRGFLVSEDLGAGPSLLDLLLGDDPEVATRGAIAFARGLGALHAQTTAGIMVNGNRVRLPHTPPRVAEHWQQVQEALAQLGLPPAAEAVDRDVAQVNHLLTQPGAYLALSSGDPSVVNCKAGKDGIRFFDFEEACFRHALVDATVLRFFYPTGGPAWQIPEALGRQMETSYRTELGRACPAAAEDESYEAGMAAASAAWMILRMARLLRVDAGPDRDSWTLLPPGWVAPIPTRSRRRQLLSILEGCVASCRRAHNLPALTTWCEHATQALRARWPEAHEALPPYPAFQ